MKKENLFRVIGDVDEQKVAVAGMAMTTKKTTPIWLKWGALAACVCLVISVFTISNLFNNGTEISELETENIGVVDTEPKETISLVGEEIDATFGYLFPREIESGYILDDEGIGLYGETTKVLQAKYNNEELNDTLLIKVAPSSYFGKVEYDAVVYGDTKTDGTKYSMVYYENNGMTIMYQFEKTDIAQMDEEQKERLYAIIHSAKCFDSYSDTNSNESNDEIDISNP